MREKRVVLVRILINYIQMLGLIASIKINWTDELHKLSRLDESATVAHSDVFGLDCAYSGKELRIKRVFLKTFLTNMVMPCYIVLIGLFWLIYFKLFKRQKIFKNPNFRYAVFVSIIVMYFNHSISLFR